MLNENLARIRKERGFTQEALAVKLNVVRQTISKWEKGTAVPDADTLCKVAQALDVSVSALLGDKHQEEPEDTASIAKSLALINEQLAVRNRRAANVWKALYIVSIIIIGILIGKICFGNNPSSDKQGSTVQNTLPQQIEISGLSFSVTKELMTCSFVPSTGIDDIEYTVTFHPNDADISEVFSDVTAKARYENGICTARFDIRKLYDYIEYTVVLNIECDGDVRNLTLATDFNFQDNGYSWNP